MKKKRIYSIILNAIIVILEIIGLLVTYHYNKRISFEYYTEDSNILALITSSIWIIYVLKNNKIPKWLQDLKYITTTCLTITFIVVIVILAPMYQLNYSYLLLYHSMLYQHLLCPLISIITFLLFDNLDIFNKKDNFKAMIITIIYAIVLIILNILKIVQGPYPFLMINSQNLQTSIFWLILMLGIAYLTALLLRIIHKNFKKKKHITKKNVFFLKKNNFFGKNFLFMI